MWVLTENGRLINLDRFYAVDVTGHQVVARSEHEISVVLCSCDNEEHGKEIVRYIADAIENGNVEFYNVRDAKFSVYTCGVCDQRFEVPRRDDKVHFLRGNVVCPDCWATGQDKVSVVLCSYDNEEHGEEAGGAVQ